MQDEQNQSPPPEPADEVISWTASEFIAHHKETNWYVMLGVATVVIAALIYLITRDPISTVVIIVVGAVFGIYGARQPRQLQYNLSLHGLRIGQRFFPLEQFRSFAVVPEGAFSSIALMPLKRFAPLTTLYYAPEDEDRIIGLLALELPYTEHQHDAIDRLMHRIRF